jgi:hypothetical protein
MRKRDPRPVMVIDEGACQLIGEAKSNEFDGVQEPLPDAMRVLLCLIDGAERRHRLVRKWQSQAAHDLLVEVEGGGIVVTLPGTSYAVTYYKLKNSPQLHGRHLPDQVDRRSPISQAASEKPGSSPTTRRASWGASASEVTRTRPASSTLVPAS